MAGLIGEFHHTIDAKGRMSVPSKFRTLLGERFVIAKGIDTCLTIYSSEEWNTFSEKLAQLPNFDDEAREIKRFFGAGSAEVEVDEHGRILVPSHLKEYAGLVKDVTIVGTTDGRAEVWNTESWNGREAKVSPKNAIKSLASKGIII